MFFFFFCSQACFKSEEKPLKKSLRISKLDFSNFEIIKGLLRVTFVLCNPIYLKRLEKELGASCTNVIFLWLELISLIQNFLNIFSLKKTFTYLFQYLIFKIF